MEATGRSYAEYREDLAHSQMPRALRTALYCAIGAIVAFVPLDYVAFHSDWLSLLAVRGVAAASVLVIYAVLNKRAPEICGLLIVASVGVMLLLVVRATGSAASDYYAGLVLLFCATPVLLPVDARQLVLVAGPLLAMFCGLALLDPGTQQARVEITHAVILSTAAAISAAAANLLDRVRYEGFQRRLEVEAARDRLAELDVAKSRFTANVHHELRTPLTLMLAPLDSMLSGDLGEIPGSLGRVLGTMRGNGLRLLKLINNLLDLAKIESDQLSIRRSLIDPAELVGSVVEGARAMADRKKVELRVCGLDSIGCFYADPDALEKIVVNLVSNALKFTDSGSVEVVGERTEDGSAFQLSVRDTGIGVPPEQLEMIFDRFAQVDGSATRRHEGSGIGLSLVSELVELHGGTVWAESAGIDLGTTVYVVLPNGEADQPQVEEVLLPQVDEPDTRERASFDGFAEPAEGGFDPIAASRAGHSEELRRSVRRWEGNQEAVGTAQVDSLHAPDTPEIVIADDNTEMRELLGFLIGREYVVRLCRNGREALDAVRERLPMLVVTDVMMPEMSGTELCQAIKGDPKLRGVPVMLVTSKAEREMKIEGLEQGADDYVTKPFHPRELLARVRSLVRVRELQAEVASQNEVLEQSNRELERAMAELKDAEVQLVQSERLAAVGELSAGVAHEVNNPLNFARNSLTALRAYVQDLQDVAAIVGTLGSADPAQLSANLAELERKKSEVRFDELSGDLGELVAIVTEGLDRTSRLVGDLRDFAAPHRGERVPVALNSSLESTLQLTRYMLREKGCEVVLELGEPLRPVLGDPSALNQVFLNLLKNAAEALDGQGGGVLTIATVEERGLVQVLVQDDGPGMDSAVKSRLFEPFFTTKEAGEGTGLGLSMCQRIVDEHGGEITIESEPGAGTRVLVSLPAHGPGAGAAHGV
jgi:signal transduction histidine kinase